MQELAGRFRGAGLHVFRHRKGMLFVSPIRPRAIDESAVSDSVQKILETLKASPRINRKDLAEKLITPQVSSEEARLKLASDLRWLVREGHLIEFNDGSLDLPRVKAPVGATAAVFTRKREPSQSMENQLGSDAVRTLPLETAAPRTSHSATPLSAEPIP